MGDAEQEPSEPLPSQEAAVLRGHEGPVLAARFNHNGQYCLTCGKDRTLRCVRRWLRRVALGPFRSALTRALSLTTMDDRQAVESFTRAVRQGGTQPLDTRSCSCVDGREGWFLSGVVRVLGPLP